MPLGWWIGTLVGNLTFLNTNKPKMKRTLLLATLVFLLKEASSYPTVTADVEDAKRGEKESSKGRELERRSAQENEETAGELICETNCEGIHIAG